MKHESELILTSALIALNNKAERLTRCRRRACVAAIYSEDDLQELFVEYNQPHSRLQCTGERGACGCAHAEERLLINYGDAFEAEEALILTTTFAPCLRCASLILTVSDACSIRFTCRYLVEYDTDPQGLILLRRAGIDAQRCRAS